MQQQPMIDYSFSPDTVELVIEGLSELAYKRVAHVIPQIAGHAQQVLRREREAQEAPPPPVPQRRLPASRVRKTRG